MKATTIAAMVLAAAAASAATIVALKKAHEKKQNARLEPMEGGDVTICTGDPIPAEDDDSDCCCEKTDTDAPKPEEADKEESAPEAGGCEGGFCSFAGAVDADDDDDDAGKDKSKDVWHKFLLILSLLIRMGWVPPAGRRGRPDR